MRPLTLRQKSVLGLFVLVSGALLALCVMLLLGLRLHHAQRPLRARFTENISGLDVNAPVRYQGLKVGRVEAIYVAPDAPEAIEVVLSVDGDVRLFEGTIAQLDPSGLTGLKAINLTPGNTQGTLLAPNTLLPTRGSFIAAITHDASAMIADVRHVADKLNHLLGDAGTRTHVEHLIAGLDRLVSHTDAVVSDPNQPLQQMIGHVDDLVTTTTRTAETINQTVQGLNQLLEHNAQGLDQLGPTVQSMARLVDDADSLVRAGRDDLLHTLGALREASDNAKDLSALVADNPAILLRGR